MPCVYFDIRDYEKILRNADKEDDKNLIALYKLLSPYFLLKVPFANDSNSLNEKFYKELLHIIGLEEVKKGNKTIIDRKEKDKQGGSLIENAINILITEDSLHRINDKTIYGQTKDEQLYSIALELSLTWINRILFLKLLEGQLITYHKGNNDYRFLNSAMIHDFDELYKLFHQVLARKISERTASIQKKYARVPYLNSSLFEISELEDLTIKINSLDNAESIELIGTTILKEEKKLTKSLPALEYLFKFLDAYDFASEGGEDIAEDSKTIINASVLGKVFEKINGYKDGSIFTPGFITMYMSRQSLRLAVTQKFNEYFKTKEIAEVSTFDELYNRIDKVDIKTANDTINSLRICDPAVGSGHFLVSVLNEMIAIKSELGILADKNGKRIRDYEIVIDNDELYISDENGIFEYNYLSKESQRVQETIFNEKQTIIENCLFGVDINTNSVKICRLRLWIELLKSSYYKAPDYTELETLPNIDINIKCGNSLISRYALDADLKKALQKSKWNISMYRMAVMTYRNAKSKDEKRAMEKLIDEIKNNFETEIQLNDKRFKKLRDMQGEMFTLTNQGVLFDKSPKEKAAWNKRVEELTTAIKKQEEIIEEIRNNVIYKNAFEWRFEFPEVLNDNGDFEGFDVVIGNPPYIRQEEYSVLKPFLKQNFKIYNSIADLLTYFVELSFNILKERGKFQFIISNKFARTNYGKEMRNFLLQNTQISHFIDLSGLPVFDEATVDAAILGFYKAKSKQSNLIYANVDKKEFDIENFEKHLKKIKQVFPQDMLSEGTWAFESPQVLQIKQKVEAQGVQLQDWDISIARGILTGLNDAFVIDSKKKHDIIIQDPKSSVFLKPLLRGRDTQKWVADYQNLWLIYIPKGYTIMSNIEAKKNLIEEPPPRYGSLEYNEAWDWFYQQLPAIASHLLPFKALADKRTDKGDFWWELRACSYQDNFEKPKIIYPNMTKFLPFVIDLENHYYHNDKSFHLISDRIYWLGAFFNSKLFEYCFRDNFPELLGGTRELRKVFFDKISVKQVTDLEEKPFKEIVTQILLLKADGKDTTQLEKQIDNLVYELYGLTEEEIGIVEGESPNS